MTDELPVFRPQRQRVLSFRGKELVTADLRDGRGYISLRSLCDAFGLDPRPQRKRLARKQSYFGPYTATILLATPGGPQPSLCLEATVVPLFLGGVEVDRLQDEDARRYMQSFLQEVHIVLAEHFGISERGEMQSTLQAIGRMVVQQEEFEEELSKKVDAELAEIRRAHEEKLNQIRAAFGGLRDQVSRLEAVSGPRARLNPEQLGQLRETVATLGALLQEQGVPKPYPGIYMDITRLTGVSRSEDIRQEDFPEVIAFLDKQVRALAKSQPPQTGVS
jgi:hypothetical protein